MAHRSNPSGMPIKGCCRAKDSINVKVPIATATMRGTPAIVMGELTEVCRSIL